MPERVIPGPVPENASVREVVSVHTNKIYDSCRDKDCIEDLRFYPTQESQAVIDRAMSVRAGQAELLDVSIEVEPVSFNRGFYTVDLRYFYRVTADAFVGAVRPVEITGLCVFDKRILLFGGEGSAKIFSSRTVPGGPDERGLRRSNVPTAYVEAVDPIVLGMKLVDRADCIAGEADLAEVPPYINASFGCELAFSGEGRRVLATLGQFSIVRLERDTQLLIPVYDYSMPDRECAPGEEDDPCEVFRSVQFPVREFFPAGAAGGRPNGAEAQQTQ